MGAQAASRSSAGARPPSACEEPRQQAAANVPPAASASPADELQLRPGRALARPLPRLVDHDRRAVDAETARARALRDPHEQLAGAAADVEDAVARAHAEAVDRLVDPRRVERVVERPVAVGDRRDAVAVHGRKRQSGWAMQAVPTRSKPSRP